MTGIGVNLFSLRTMIKTEENFLRTAIALRDMGYDCMQFSGAPFDAEMICRVVGATGMSVPLTHVPLDRILDDTDRLMSEHASFDCQNIGLGTLPREALADEDKTKATIGRLAEVAEKMAARGFRLYYHNHHTDAYRYGDTTILDYMIENVPAMHFTLDTYWLQYGGLDVVDYITRLSGRIGCVHLKDYKIVATRGEGDALVFKPRFAPVGEGNLDFKRIIPAMRASGTKYFLVEQDDAVTYLEPLYEIKRSIDYIKGEGLL